MKRSAGTIGRSLHIRGDVSATGDLTIDGRVSGTITVDKHVLTIGPNGRTEGQVCAKVVDVQGKVDGELIATETITVRQTATVDGSLEAPRVGIEEGASFRGQIDINMAIPLDRVIRRLKPERASVRFIRRLVDHSISAFRPQADPVPLIGVSPKLAAATMRLLIDADARGTRSHQRR